MRTTKKGTNDRRQFSQAADLKLLLLVASQEKPRNDDVAQQVPASYFAHSWLRWLWKYR